MSRSNSVVPHVPPVAIEPGSVWSIEDALETYAVPHWGKGYFGINEQGHVTVHPTKDPARSIDLSKLVEQLGVRGVHPPILVRFTDILRHRVREIAEAFRSAIDESHYRGAYRCVYPIKVNQQRHVVEEIRDFGAEFGFGLEAGSKPELLAVLALSSNDEVPVICNGFKDDEFIETVILAQKLGKTVIPVVEKWTELELIVKYAELHGVKPMLGVRVKLSTRGAGRWEESGGARSKFGLFISEVIDALNYLKQRNMADCLKLLHFHLGSQITNIRNIKEAVTELGRVYVALKGAGAGLDMIDIGGGLGVDYDGSQTNYESSMNYSINEYAADIVYRLKSLCDEADVDHPTIISESGRAMVAYHSVLIFNVLGVSRFDSFQIPDKLPKTQYGEDLPQPIHTLWEWLKDVNKRNCIECYHDIVTAHEEAMNLFALGFLSLELRSLADRLLWAGCTKILKLAGAMKQLPEELAGLPAMMSDTYFCNFSVFQSLPDSWAIDHRFPIMPIHRLNERPARRGILADITCDSDGKIDHFIDLRDDKQSLELHEYIEKQPYLLGAFLVGAYQEILGDLHNLLGDTHAVHVSMDAEGQVEIAHVVQGDTVREALSYVQFSADELLGRMRRDVERAVKAGKISLSESAQFMRFYEKGLNGYTYLEEPLVE
jgi:arginine decarboxylase